MLRINTRRWLPVVVASPLLLGALACAPADDSSSEAADPGSSDCDTDQLPLYEDGVLTVGTDSPAFEPWFAKDDPTNGEGYESAVAYEVAKRLGFSEDQVEWTVVPFNNSYAPGEKKFDFDINQISISEAREKAVDFSEGYYTASQAVVTLKDSPAADVGSIAELADFNLGAQTGTTSLQAIRDVIAPASDPLVFDDTNVAKQALQNGQVDAIVADLPTAFYISAAEIPGSDVVGQFQVDGAQSEEFGLLFEQGNELVPCVNGALQEMKDDGTLDDLQQQWLSDSVNVPELQ